MKSSQISAAAQFSGWGNCVFGCFNEALKQPQAPRKPPTTGRTAHRAPHPRESVSISILAGGLSTRMGRDKARARLGERTLLGHARAIAGELGLPVRVIRRDLVPRCGPLGGVFTALKTSRADVEVFLACDMPLVTPALLRRLLRAVKRRPAAFTSIGGPAGFPFVLRVKCLPVVARQVERGCFSLQSLAVALSGHLLQVPDRQRHSLININTTAELDRARRARRGAPG